MGRRSDWYSHGLLLHDTDEELVEATRAFVDQGLASDGEVLVHGTRDRVTLMRDVLGSHPRLEYGFDEELYLEPTRTLFTYQHKLADRPEQTEFWVTGTVPLGLDAASRAAWARYESAVDAALAPYPFHALCTYDTRCRPEEVIAAALATHSVIGAVGTTQASPQYLDPAAFLADPLAQVPVPPTSQPSWTYTVEDLNDLAWVRKGFSAGALSGSAVSSQSIDQFLVAVHEVASNGLFHGGPPVRITLWTDLASLTCLVEDSGPGDLDPMTGFRHPEDWEPMGLWVARQLVDELFIGNTVSGGCSVLLTVT